MPMQPMMLKIVHLDNETIKGLREVLKLESHLRAKGLR
jgi:hypothetical protein